MKSNDSEEWVVCRACLKQPEEEMQCIFDVNPVHDLSEMLAECIGLPVGLNDDFPDKICSKCIKYLRVAYKFRITCRRSYEHLSQILLKSEDPQQQQVEYQRQEDSVDYVGSVGCNVDFKVEIDDDMNDENMHTKNDEDPETLEIYMPIEEVHDNEDITEDTYEEFQVIEQSDSYHDNDIIDEIVDGSMNSDEEFLPTHKIKIEAASKNASTSKQILTDFPIEVKQEVAPAEKLPKKRGRKKVDKPSSYICDVCANIYPSQGRLTEHMKFHSDIKPHECEICGRGFVQAQQLVRHMNTHTGNRPYKCNYCPAAFADRSTKTKHHRIHTNEKPYVCDVCNRAFTYSDNLKFHKMLHTGEKPHVCDICGKGFTKAYKLKSHKATHEKKGIYAIGT